MTSAIETRTPRRMRRRGAAVGRTALAVLAAIHLVLPLTPANEHNELQIYIAAALIGGVFAYLTWMSFGRPRRSFVIGAAAFTAVEAIAAASGASPLTEGWGVKLAVTGAFLFAIVSTPRQPDS